MYVNTLKRVMRARETNTGSESKKDTKGRNKKIIKIRKENENRRNTVRDTRTHTHTQRS